MPVATQDRPINAVREETIDQLIMNYGHGQLSLEAFERRLDQALDAKSHEQLVALTEDLDLVADKQYTDKKRSELGLASSNGAPSRSVEHMVHIFGGSNRSGAWAVAREIRMLNLFGGAELDFTNAQFAAQETHIKMLCLFGGATLYVPENVNTVSRALCLFGGIDNRASYTPDQNATTIVIEGLVLFGGASIRVKRTLKERWLAFADTIKEMLAQAPPSRPARHSERTSGTP